MDALIDRLVSLQRKMVLNYRFEFKDQLAAKLKECDDKLAEMWRPCGTDQER